MCEMLAPRAAAPRLATGLLAAGALALPACGGSNDDTTVERAAPEAASFPPANGRPLQEVLAEADSEGPVVSPAVQVFHKGENRFGFGVFTTGGEQITDAEVAIYVAHGPSGETKGPYPARVENLETDPAYESKTTADDPDAARVVYVTEVDLDKDGEWRIGALTRDGDSLQASVVPSAVVGKFSDIPRPGDKAPRVHTPTAEEVGGDLAEIDTRDPPGSMHEHDLAEVLGEQPVVLLFATPQLCQSRVCGPVVDVAEQVKADYGDDVAFIHMEIYEDNLIDKGLRPQVKAYGLPTEPWLFVIDAEGRIRTSIEGAFSADELRRAVEEAAR
jgi:hypothetical protein